ncbi:MAG: helix-turn-helix domain-containing protein [Candidatus Methylomirabilales bacterium]
MGGVQSVERALAILVALSRNGGPVGVSSLGQELGLPKSTVHRLLSALQRAGVVVRHAGGRYGASLAALGPAAPATRPPARPRAARGAAPA